MKLVILLNFGSNLIKLTLYCSFIERYVQSLNMKKIKSQDEFEVLRKLNKDTQPSQREMAKQLGFSLGKLNYCLQALKDKGLVKIKNFQKQEDKVNYFKSYILTPKGDF